MPASYPTAVKTFTTKNAGDTIQPAHINDLQDEVVAIEQGLLGGVSPLQSSNSTLANLSVPGLSTFTGNVKMDGTLTVNKIVSTSISAAGVTSYVKAYATATQQSPNTSFLTAALNSEIADLLGEFDSTTYTFTPQSSGYYLITGRITIGPSAGGGGVRAGLFVNSSAIMQHDYNIGGGAGVLQTYPLNAAVNLSSGSAGAVTVRWCSAGSTGVVASTGVQYTSLEIIKLF